MIKLVNVNKSYGNVKAVNDISIELKSGQIFGFLGPNGAGKTTTIKMMTGLLKPDSGTILINNKDMKKNSIEAKKEFGYVPDSSGMFLRLTGTEYLNLVADIYDVPSNERNKAVDELSEKFDIKNVLGNRIQSYSHGMRQKLAIIGSVLHEPNIWILDEPLTGLDPKASFALKELMKQYAYNGKVVFFSTHILEVAEKICDSVIVINKGKILYNGEICHMNKSLSEDNSLEKMFLELTNDE